jgi:phage terminase small subunit
MPKLRGLSLKQQRFIDAYLEKGNATQAAIDAGYKCRSRAVAQTIGSQNLLNPMIAARLAQRRAEISAQTGITVESVQNRLLAEAELASQEGKRSAAVAAYGTLLKSIGGMTGDRPHPYSIVGKALDAKKAEDLRAIAEMYYSQKYLAQPIEQPTTRLIDDIGCPTIEGPPGGAGQGR